VFFLRDRTDRTWATYRTYQRWSLSAMRRLFAAIRQKWNTLHGGDRPALPFSINCACGEVHLGKRGSRHQGIRFGKCGEMLLVWPRRPVALTGDEDDAPQASKLARSTWVPPVAAGALTLLVVVLLLVLFFTNLGAPDKQARDNGKPDRPPESIKEEGRKLLAE